MDPLQLIAELAKALAWPCAIIIIFFALRKQIVERLPDVESFEYKGLKVGFAKQVERVSSEAKQVLPESANGFLLNPPVEDSRRQLAELSPRAAILESWIELERAAIDSLKNRGLPISDRDIHRPKLLLSELRKAELLNASQVQVWEHLRTLRNAAAHATNLRITPDTAKEFVDIASSFERVFQDRAVK